ncbi:MAG TPA: chromosome segregation protein SMC [Chthoniobacterales bacterium]|jgi:chromosome segregation protein|nr:chromosome segregation protein SMC [Chthoniobacterales bacterium]
MHLQSLELFGFKSFADKTLVDFHEGVTAIVGPNGCGKSNILDAIKWVLGEQSAKSLRGGEMADVIFNGTDNRKPLSFAEVSLTFTDCASELNVDWHDVRVTRRVYRDGNSEYLLNKTVCRLKDIQNLFADTGVARSAYSMMEQGKIDMILSSRPEDRRAIFEEAAGITKYKSQKKEALRKLEATEANLLRIGDVIKEVKRQIGSLQRQAGKARRYQALHADLRVIETHHSKKQLAKLESDLAHCRAEIEQITTSEQGSRSKIDNGESELAQERLALDKIDIEVSDIRAEAQRLQSEVAAHKSRIEFNRQRKEELTSLIQRARGDIENSETKRKQHEAQIRETNSLIEKTQELLQSKQNDLAKITEALDKLRAARETRETQRDLARVSLSKYEARIDKLEDDFTGLTARRELTQEQIRQLGHEITEATSARERIAAEILAAHQANETEQKKLEELLGQSQNAEASLKKNQELVSNSESEVATLERALAEKRSTLEILRELNAAGEGLAQGSQAVLKGLDDPERFRDSIVGSLVAQVDVDPKFIPAIEAALGRNLHAVVLKDAQAAEEILARLTKKKLGQAALFVPKLNGSAHESVRKSLPKGAIAWAIDKVVAPRAIEPLVRQLLSGVVIFSRLDDALAAKKDEPTLAMATIDGEFISTAGVIFGGSSTVKVDSLLERKARVSELEKEFRALESEREAFAQKRDEAKANLEAASRRLEEARAQHQAAQLSHSTSAHKISLLETDHKEAERKIDNLKSEKSTLEQQIAAAGERVAELEQELAAARDELAEQEAAQSEADKDEKGARSHEEKAIEELNDLRLAIATARQRLENLEAQRQPMAARDAELIELIAARRADIESYESKLEAQAQENRDAEIAIKEQAARAMEAEAKANEIASQRAERIAAVQKRETELRGLRDSLSSLQETRGHQQVRESQLQMQIENLAENISRRYQVDLREFTPDAEAFEKTLRVQLKRAEKESAADVDLAEEDLQNLIADLTRQLDNMGPVNLDAVQEYDELEERYKFLETQNTDLTNSRRELLDVIAKINATTKQLFADTFAQVRANFKEMFAELFGGGRSDLALMDENDPLNCGIEITAKPPGKQLQSVSLLSGGERAMTAVALLFAIYMVRPSPFCILDEIDAPLDESNINRFTRMLDRFIAQSQFIIITHNKRTISKADVLYGITMEERGISKLVGMKLTAPPAAEQTTSPQREPAASQRQFALAENGNGHGEKKASRAH